MITILIKNQMRTMHRTEVEVIVRFFLAKVIAPEVLDHYRNGQLSWSDMRSMGYFSKEDFYLYSVNVLGKDSVPEQVLNQTLELLCEASMLTPFGARNIISTPYSINNQLVAFYHERGLIYCAMFGFPEMIDHFSQSVYKIEPTYYDETHSIGTGFLVVFPNAKHSVIVTNKHVVEKASKVRLLTYNDIEVAYSRIVESEVNDIAAIILNEVPIVNSFCLGSRPQVLDDIVTMGYPSVPMTQNSYLLCHRGEINALVKDYIGNEYMLFSAKTTSGNSGGPVVDSIGRVVGMVTEEFFDEHAFVKKGKLPYYAAIPSDAICNFLNSIFVV